MNSFTFRHDINEGPHDKSARVIWISTTDKKDRETK